MLNINIYTNKTLALMQFFLVLNLITGCASVSLKKNPVAVPKSIGSSKRIPLNKESRSLLVTFAQGTLGKSSLKVGKKTFRADCSGTIRAFFTKARIELGGIIKDDHDNDVKIIYRYVRKYGSIITKAPPQPGDLVFFHNTYDRRGNNRMNNALTHIGLVEKVDDTIIHFIHYFGKIIVRSRMDLSKPHLTYDPRSKKRINHFLRRAQGSYRAYTAAELFAGFGRL